MGNEVAKSSSFEGDANEVVETDNDLVINESKSFRDILLGSGGDILSTCSSSDRYDPVLDGDMDMTKTAEEKSAEVEVVAANTTDDVYLLSSEVASQSDDVDNLSDHLSRALEQLADTTGREFILERHSSSSPIFFDAQDSYDIDDYMVQGNEGQGLTADERSHFSDQHSSSHSLSDDEEDALMALPYHEEVEKGVPTLTPEKALSLLDDSVGLDSAGNSSVALNELMPSIHSSDSKHSMTPTMELSQFIVETSINTPTSSQTDSTRDEMKTQSSEEKLKIPCYLNCCDKFFTGDGDAANSTNEKGVLSCTQDETHDDLDGEMMEKSLEMQRPRPSNSYHYTNDCMEAANTSKAILTFTNAPKSSNYGYDYMEATNTSNCIMTITTDGTNPVSISRDIVSTFDDITGSLTNTESTTSDSFCLVSTTDGVSSQVDVTKSSSSQPLNIIVHDFEDALRASDMAQPLQGFIPPQAQNSHDALSEPISTRKAHRKLVPRKDFLIKSDILDHDLFVPLNQKNIRSSETSFSSIPRNYIEERDESHVTRPSINIIEEDLNRVTELLQPIDIFPHLDVSLEKATNISSENLNNINVNNKKRMCAMEFLELSFGRLEDFTRQEQALALIKWHQLLSQSKYAHVTRMMKIGIGFKQFYYINFLLKGEDKNGRFFSQLMGMDEFANSDSNDEEDGSDLFLQRPVNIDFPSVDERANIVNDDPVVLRNKVILDDVVDTEILLTTLLSTAQSEVDFFTHFVQELVDFSVKKSVPVSTELHIKKLEDIINKAQRKYQGDILRVKDILRASILFHDEISLYRSLLFLYKYSQSHPEIDIVRIKNLFWSLYEGCMTRTNLPTGYRHVLVSIRLQSGLLAGEIVILCDTRLKKAIFYVNTFHST